MKRAPKGKMMSRPGAQIALPELPMISTDLGTPGLMLPNITGSSPGPISGSVSSVETSAVPDLDLISNIPGITPYLLPSLIPDLIDMYRAGGIRKILQTYKVVKSNRSITDLQKELIDILSFQGVTALSARLQQLFDNPSLSEFTISQLLKEGGDEIILDAISRSNSLNPESIIFESSLQELNFETQKIDYELNTRTPDVEERTDMSCKCGSKKIFTRPVQIRRADEPPALLAQCVVCKTKWIRSTA